MLHVASPELFRPVAAYLTLIALARAQAPNDFEFRTSPYEFETTVPAFDLLTGSAKAREALLTGARAEDLVELVTPVDPSWRDVVTQAEDRVARASA
jgi:hypothetical protein